MHKPIIVTIYRPDGSIAFGPAPFFEMPEHQVQHYCRLLACSQGLAKFSVHLQIVEAAK